jgi:hypothetical protein
LISLKNTRNWINNFKRQRIRPAHKSSEYSEAANLTDTSLLSFADPSSFSLSRKTNSIEKPSHFVLTTIKSQSRNERHPSPPHASISRHSQQFWAVQFSILPNWISFPRALHAQLLHPKRRRSIKDSNAIRRDAALRMRTVHKRNP